MKDRLRMSAEGIFIISLAVTGNYVIDDPIIESRGYVFAGNRDADKEIKSVVHKAVEQYDYESGNKDELASAVKKALKNYIFKKTKQSPHSSSYPFWKYNLKTQSGGKEMKYAADLVQLHFDERIERLRGRLFPAVYP